jgi:hypothetical protein
MLSRKKAITIAIIITILALTVIVPIQAEGPFYGSKNSDVYHYGSCSYVDRIKSSNLVTFTDAQDAVNSGYRPCKVCHPPLPASNNPSPSVPELTPLALATTLVLASAGIVLLKRKKLL